MSRPLATLALSSTLALTGCVFPAGAGPVGSETASSGNSESSGAPTESGSQASQPSLVEKTGEEVVKSLSARETCAAWQEIVRSIFAGTVTAGELDQRVLVVSLGAPAALRAESAAAADVLMRPASGAQGDSVREKDEKVIAELRAACKVEAKIDIMPR